MLTIQDFEALTDRFMISDENQIMEKINGSFVDSTLDIYDQLLVRGANFDDSWQLLKLYLYFKYFVRPYKLPNSKVDDLIDRLTYRQITGINQDTHTSLFWHLPPFAGNRKIYNQVILRRGSEAQWSKGGEYIRQSLIADDQTPQFTIYWPTHAFALGSPIAKYNWIYGRHQMDEDNEGALRFYFNVDLNRSNVKRLIQNIQKIFDLYGIPFKVKFLAERPAAGRTDPVVLYVERKYPFVVFFLVKDIFESSRSLLREDVPMFVKQLGPGLGFAEDPVNSDSFGMFTCELLADALLFAKGVENDQERFSQVIDYICNHRGFEPGQIYRGTTRHYNYDQLFKVFDPAGNDVNRVPYRPIYIRPLDEGDFFNEPGIQRTRFLIAAIRIAYQLCKEAFWAAPEVEVELLNDWRCNWLTFKPANLLPEPEIPNPISNGLKGHTDSLINDLERIQTKLLLDDETFSLRSIYTACTPVEKQQIAYFLRKVNRFYYSDIFEQTIKYTSSNDDLGDIQLGEFAWSDTKLNQAWAHLFGHLSQEGVSTFETKVPDMEVIGDYLIKYYLKDGHLIGNCFINESPDQNANFCPTLTHGLAGVGFFLLNLYDESVTLGN